MTFKIHKAERKKARLKIGISSASGGGKTYSALLMASGMTDWSKIYLIDTESGSADLYSHLGAYNVLTLIEPHTPERYIEAMKACEEAGAEVIIIDSTSHMWEELLAQHSKMTGNSFTNWRYITPRYDAFVKKILTSPAHIITTTRRKKDYSMDKDASGKTVVTKVGMKEIQREEFDFELTVNFALDQNHMAQAEKDRTGLFVDKPLFKISADTGKTMKEWAESGVEAVEVTPDPVQIAKEVFEVKTDHIDNLKAELIKMGAKNDSEALTMLNSKIGTVFTSLDLTDKQAKTALIKLLQTKND